jgi:hypothetical protein
MHCASEGDRSSNSSSSSNIIVIEVIVEIVAIVVIVIVGNGSADVLDGPVSHTVHAVAQRLVLGVFAQHVLTAKYKTRQE